MVVSLGFIGGQLVCDLIINMEDTKREPIILEHKRRWTHGDGCAPDCGRRKEPVYTDLDKVPRPCGEGVWRKGCGEGQWYGAGKVIRDKKTKQIVHEEK